MPKGKFSLSDIDTGSAREPINYQAIEENLNRPKWWNDPKGWWKNLSDDEKQGLLDAIFETTGGTLGAVAGGGPTPTGILGAGAGSVAGRSAARQTGRAMGIKQKPTTVAQELDATALTAVTGAAGEGFGRAIPIIGRAVKAGGRIPFQPTAEAKLLQQLADKYGVPLNLGQATGKNWLKSIEIGLHRNPIASDTVRAMREKQYHTWETALNDWLDKLHSGEVSQEEFARAAESTFKTLRNQFNQDIETTAKNVAKTLHPTPVGKAEAGIALKQGHEANLNRVRAWAKDAYGNHEQQYGDTPIDLEPWAAKAREMLAPIPQGERAKFFPQKALDYLQASASTAANEFIDAGGGKLIPKAPTVSLSELLAMRSELLDASRRLNPDGNQFEIRALHEMIDGATEALEKGLTANPKAGPAALAELKKINAHYRDFMEKLRPPAVPGKPGNPAVRLLRGKAGEIPENLPGQLTASPTMTQQTITAASPKTTAGYDEIFSVPDPDYPDMGNIVVVAVRKGANSGKKMAPDSFEGRATAAALQQRGLSADDVIGIADIADYGKYIQSEGTYVPEAWQKRGIGTALYDFAEKQLGKPIRQAPVVTPEGKALNASRARRGPPSPDPIAQLQRTVFDTAIENATLTDPATGLSRVSPIKMSRSLPESAPTLYGPKLPMVQSLGQPPKVAREDILYRHPFAKAVDTGKTETMFSAGLPRRMPERAKETLALFGETGQESTAQRGLLQKLVDESRMQDPTIGPDEYINPRRLAKKIGSAAGGYGETIPAMIGSQRAGELQELATLGRGSVGENAHLRNTSGTSAGNVVVNFTKRLFNPTKWPEMAAEIVPYNLAGKQFYNPAVVRKMTAPATVDTTMGGPLLGASGRAIMQMHPMGSPQSIEDIERHKKSEGEFTLDDIQ